LDKTFFWENGIPTKSTIYSKERLKVTLYFIKSTYMDTCMLLNIEILFNVVTVLSSNRESQDERIV